MMTVLTLYSFSSCVQIRQGEISIQLLSPRRAFLFRTALTSPSARCTDDDVKVILQCSTPPLSFHPILPRQFAFPTYFFLSNRNPILCSVLFLSFLSSSIITHFFPIVFLSLSLDRGLAFSTLVVRRNLPFTLDLNCQ